MNRRIRLLAALLALIGFTAYFAESLVAMSCIAEAPAGETSAAAASYDGVHHAPHAPAEPDADVPHCPLGMAGGSSCLVPATLPVAASAARVPGPEAEPSVAAIADAAHSLFVRTLFHPPRV
jgi:hypothetical protein